MQMQQSCTEIIKCHDYCSSSICTALPEELFKQIEKGNNIVIKPNWVMECHKNLKDDWEYVITHPEIITAVIRKVLDRLNGDGRIAIIDGPMTEASFEKLISHYPVDEWRKLCRQYGISLDVIDLREHEWTMRNDVVVERKSIPGDPNGKVLVDLMAENSEFYGHKKSQRGYYGADYDRAETNQAHDGIHNLYSVSRSVIESDVFVNMPKLKTHRTAGITCCLKNLVGINTYKNYLPHYSEGSPSEGGDQFPLDNLNARIEGPLNALIKQHVLKNPIFAKYLTPLNTVGKKLFGDSKKVVRNGSWFGNDTMWRMILDLNKLLLYANPDGTMRNGTLVNAKRYIGVVDAVIAGDGEGPLAPDPVPMGSIICGTNPVAIDATCAVLMGFDPLKIPTIFKTFQVKQFPLCDFALDDIQVLIENAKYSLASIPSEYVSSFRPQHGWLGHIENNRAQ